MSRRLVPSRVVTGGLALAAGVVALVAVLGMSGGRTPTGASPGPVQASPARSTHGPTQRPTTSAPRPLSIVGVGDSVAAGTNCACAPFLPRFAELIGTRDSRPAADANLGLPGLTTNSLGAQLAQPGPSRSVAGADLVVVTIGANDLVPLEDQWERAGCDAECMAPVVSSMARGLGADLARIKALGRTGQRVEVTTYWNVFEDGDVADRHRGAGFADWSDRVTLAANQAICATTRTYGGTCVDLYSPFLGADGSRNPTSLLASDGDHPNAAGHALIARALLAATPR